MYHNLQILLFYSIIRGYHCSRVFDCYNSFTKYVFINLVTKTLIEKQSFTLTFGVITSTLISTQFFVLNFDGWFGVLFKRFIIFDIPLLSYYINFNLPIISCLSSGGTYISFGISLSNSIFSISLSNELFETFVILSAILLLIKSPVASAIF